jgi:hypothetical protein
VTEHYKDRRVIAKAAHGGQSKTSDRWSDHKHPQPMMGMLFFTLGTIR